MFGTKKKEKLTKEEQIMIALKFNLDSLCFNSIYEIKQMERASQKLAKKNTEEFINKNNSAYKDYIKHEKQITLIDFVNRRLGREPLEYIIGETEFAGREFITTPDVYITAPETEWLNNVAKDLARDIGAKRILDVGTGNGVLGLSLALEYSGIESLVLSDTSPEALEVAKENIKRYQEKLQGVNIGARKSNHVDSLKDCEEPDIILACLPCGDENNLLESNKKRKLNETEGYNIKLALYTNGSRVTGNFSLHIFPPDRMEYVEVENKLIYRDLNKMPEISRLPQKHTLEKYESLFKSIQKNGWDRSIVIFETGMHSYTAVNRILPEGYILEQKYQEQILQGTNGRTITLKGNVSIAYRQRK